MIAFDNIFLEKYNDAVKKAQVFTAFSDGINYDENPFEQITEVHKTLRFWLSEVVEYQEASTEAERLDACVDAFYFALSQSAVLGNNISIKEGGVWQDGNYVCVRFRGKEGIKETFSLDLLDVFDSESDLNIFAITMAAKAFKEAFDEEWPQYGPIFHLYAGLALLAYLQGIKHGDFWGAFDAVHTANMAKFMDSETAAKTIEHYKKQDTETCIRSINDNTYAVIRKSDGKILKPWNWTAPNIEPFVNK